MTSGRNIFDEDDHAAERALEAVGQQSAAGKLTETTLHAAGSDEKCPICCDTKRLTVVEHLYSRGEPPAEIGKLVGCSGLTVRAHARGLNLDIALSKDTDRTLALLINQGVHDLRPHSVDAKVTLEAIKLRATIDGKIIQHVKLDRPTTIVFIGDSPEPGVVQARPTKALLQAPPVQLDVPNDAEIIPARVTGAEAAETSGK